MIKHFLLTMTFMLSFSAFAAEDTCTLDFDTGINAFVDETSNALPSYFSTKNKEEKLQIEAVLLPSGANLVTIAGGCEHITVRFQYSVDPSLSDETEPQNAIEKAELLLRETPLTKAGQFYGDIFKRGIEKAKLSPDMASPGRLNISTTPDAEVILDYSQRGALNLTYFFAL